MANFDRVASFNFFADAYTNHLVLPQNECVFQSLGRKFLESSTRIVGAMSVMDWAQVDQECQRIPDEVAHWPFVVKMEGQNVLGWPDEYQEEFYDQFKKVPANTRLFKIYALDKPESEGG